MRPVWSSALLEELEYHEALKLERRHALPQTRPPSAPGARSRRCTPRATTRRSRGAIVTDNTKDFPIQGMRAGLEVVRPSVFAENTVALDPGRAHAAVTALAERAPAGRVRSSRSRRSLGRSSSATAWTPPSPSSEPRDGASSSPLHLLTQTAEDEGVEVGWIERQPAADLVVADGAVGDGTAQPPFGSTEAGSGVLEAEQPATG